MNNDWIDEARVDAWHRIKCDSCSHNYTQLVPGILYSTKCPKCGHVEKMTEEHIKEQENELKKFLRL